MRFTAAQVEHLTQIFYVDHISAGSKLFNGFEVHSAAENYCFLLLEGRVSRALRHTEISGKANLGEFGSGHFIGESLLLTGSVPNYEVTAKTDCVALRLTESDMNRLRIDNPQLAMELYRALSDQLLHAARDQESVYSEILFKDVLDEKVNETVAKAKAAQQEMALWSDEKIDGIIIDIANLFRRELSYLAKREVEETKLGNANDKEHKLNLVLTAVVDGLLGVKTIGQIEPECNGVAKYASPIGVIFGIIPMTNPIPNSLFKSLLCIKTRNALIASYPRAATKLGSYGIAIIRKVLVDHGAPANLIQHVPLPSSHLRGKLFMSHKDVNLILATGGSDLVKSAYSSGTPAYGVGPGNVPVLITANADYEQAAKDIVKGKSYENGIVCGSESNLLVSPRIKKPFVEALERAGAAVLSPLEILAIREHVFDAKKGRLKREYIGMEGMQLALAIGVTRPYPIRVLVIPTELDEFPVFGQEKMAPVLAMFTVKDEDSIELAKKMILTDGSAHTAVIHSLNRQEVEHFAEVVPAGRLLVNTPATHGMLGDSTNIPVTFMLGCGSWGGNISTDGIQWRHLVNIKSLAFDNRKPRPM